MMHGAAATLTYFLVLIGTAFLWEFIAWALHKHVMHGPGWFLHQDHHHPKGRGFQKNDLYALIFALVSFLLIYEGLLNRLGLMAAAGFGVALYGLGYVLFHEILFHRRLRWLRIPVKGRYLKSLVASHSAHHRVSTKRGASNFSFLLPGKVEKKIVQQ